MCPPLPSVLQAPQVSALDTSLTHTIAVCPSICFQTSLWVVHQTAVFAVQRALERGLRLRHALQGFARKTEESPSTVFYGL